MFLADADELRGEAVAALLPSSAASPATASVEEILSYRAVGFGGRGDARRTRPRKGEDDGRGDGGAAPIVVAPPAPALLPKDKLSDVSDMDDEESRDAASSSAAAEWRLMRCPERRRSRCSSELERRLATPVNCAPWPDERCKADERREARETTSGDAAPCRARPVAPFVGRRRGGGVTSTAALRRSARLRCMLSAKRASAQSEQKRMMATATRTVTVGDVTDSDDGEEGEKAVVADATLALAVEEDAVVVESVPLVHGPSSH